MIDLSLLEITILNISLGVWGIIILQLTVANLIARLLVNGVTLPLRWRADADEPPPRVLMLNSPLILVITFTVVGLGTQFLGLSGFTLILLRWILLALLLGSMLWLLIRLYFVVTGVRFNSPDALITTRLLYIAYGFIACFIVIILYIQYPIRCVPNCVSSNLGSTNLSGLNLSDTDFLESNLIGAALVNADLSGSDFSGARMIAANLQDSDLTNTTFVGADLRNVDLRNATLVGVDFTGARLDGANLTDTDLTDVTLHGAILDEAILVRVNLANAELRGTSMVNATMTSINLRNADLVGAVISGSDISGAVLDGADLSGAWLNMVDLSNSSLEDTVLRGAFMVGARMPSTNLRGTHMEGTVLLGVNLGGADLSGANLTGIRIFPSEFLNQGVLRADPVLSEMNEISRSRVVTTVRMSGVIFDDTTIWPPTKRSLLLDRLDTQAVEIAQPVEDDVGDEQMTDEMLANEAVTVPTAPPSFRISTTDISLLTGNIVGDGSQMVFPLSEALATDFERQGFGGQLFMQESSTTNGFDLLCNRGTADFVYATRYINNSELEACASQGRRPLAIRIGTLGALVVIVSPLNDFINNLTVDDLAEALTLQRWTDVNSSYPPLEIQRYLPATGTEAYEVLVNQILQGDDEVLLTQSNTQFDNSDANLVWELLSGDASGFAIVDFEYFQGNMGLVRGIPLEEVEPDVQGVEGTIYPLQRPVLIYADINTLQRNYHVVAFLSHYLNNVSNYIADFGFSPLLPENYDREKNNFLLALAGTR